MFLAFFFIAKFIMNSDINNIKMCIIIVVTRLTKNSSGTILIRFDSSGLNNHRSLENRTWWNLIQKELKLYAIIQDNAPITIKKETNTLLNVLEI